MSATVAVVAGGGGPLGHATAVALAADGLTVVAVDTQAVAPHMRQQGSGAIVHVAARPGIEPASGMGAYSVSKAAVVHLTRILDIELRPRGIRVNAVAPQVLDTPNQADPARRTCRAGKIGWAIHSDPAEPATPERPARPRPGG
jgi:NAD(P)-dependent dehydrogenase (short-subunit alcohol dehydrogenase family)